MVNYSGSYRAWTEEGREWSPLPNNYAEEIKKKYLPLTIQNVTPEFAQELLTRLKKAGFGGFMWRAGDGVSAFTDRWIEVVAYGPKNLSENLLDLLFKADACDKTKEALGRLDEELTEVIKNE